MDKLTSYDICTKYGCLSRIFTLITYFIMLFVVILLLNIIHYFDSLSLMHDIQILLKRSCFLVEPSKTATFSDLVKVVGKRIKNEKHKFGVLYENGKLESHWLTNEEINNKTR